jgi:hypothetical protein
VACDLSAECAAGDRRGRTCGGLRLRKPRKSLDWTGTATVAVGLAAITWGLGAIPASGFYDQIVVGALGVGVVFLLLFLAIEARSKERAMMPLSLYNSRDFSAANALTLLLTNPRDTWNTSLRCVPASCWL